MAVQPGIQPGHRPNPRNHPSGIQEIYSSLDAFWAKELRITMKALQDSKKSITLDSMVSLVHSEEAITLNGHDEISGTTKALRRTNVHVAGVSCKPFSPIGAQSGTSSSEMTAMAAWAAIQYKLGHDVIVVEESALFPCDILKRLFGERYVWQSVIIDGTSFGHPVRRKRFYAVGHHLATVGEANDWERCVACLRLGVPSDPHRAFFSSQPVRFFLRCPPTSIFLALLIAVVFVRRSVRLSVCETVFASSCLLVSSDRLFGCLSHVCLPAWLPTVWL